MPESNAQYIDVKTAIEHGYGSRSTLSRWAQKGVVRSFRNGPRLMLAVADLDAVKAARNASAASEADVVESLSRQIAASAPALSPASRARLAELLR